MTSRELLKKWVGPVVLCRHDPCDPFAQFSEWADEANRAYDVLTKQFPAERNRPA